MKSLATKFDSDVLKWSADSVEVISDVLLHNLQQFKALEGKN